MAGHGGAWKVAYADFVTAMMAFFMVMWIVAQNKPVKEAVAKYFKDPSGHSSVSGNKSGSTLPLKEGGPSPLDKSPFNSAKGRPSTQPGPQSSETTERRTGAKSNRIALAADENSTVGMQVIFQEESAELDESGRNILDQMAPALLGKVNKIEIRGHALGRLPPGSPFKNPWELSYARSVATMKYLLDKGVDPRRIRLSQSGANDPNMLDDGAGGRVKNSRVEVYVLNEVITSASDAEQRRNDRSKKTAPKRTPHEKTTSDEDSN
jgi:chemotaxis protein MotB